MFVNIGPYSNNNDPRQIEIKIEDYDVWSADITLAMIILPVLEKVKQNKHSAPDIDPADVPQDLRPTEAEVAQYNKDGTADANFFNRWNYVLDEMIWTFDEIVNEREYDQCFNFTNDPVWDSSEEFPGVVVLKDSGVEIDSQRLQQCSDRVNNGLRLFGKYFRSLWV